MNTVRLGNRKWTPGKILCVGRNYPEHIRELNNAVPEEMVVFHKPNSSISDRLIAFHQEPLHYETEICFLIKDNQYHGIGLGLDLTKRSLQSQLKAQGLPWERAKAFDGSAVFSRFIPLKSIDDIRNINFELLINCVRIQYGAVPQMIYSPETILEELRTYTTLCDGDIVMTGTPQGVGIIQAEDIFLARLKNNEHILIETEWVASSPPSQYSLL